MENERRTTENLLDKPGGILGLGCLIIISIAGIGALSLSWLGHEMLQANSDPEMRHEIAKTFLHAEAIPEDLSPVVAMSMRGTMELVILSDKPLRAGEDTPHFKNQGLYFMRVQGASMGAMPGEFEEQFLKPQNTADGVDYLAPSMRDGFVFESGNFQHSGAQGKFVSVRGTLDVFGWRGAGLQNRFSIQCSKTNTPTLGVWFMKETKRDGNDDSSPLVIDALKRRLENFNFCPPENAPADNEANSQG